ncbi:MAG: aminopeptidase N [Gammaproteobacteria bacterium]|jgi:aminopeptidase N|nr:aminopeptidase N [Gammaproteobacteria bacterium]
MKKGSPRAIRLKDYTPPPFLIDTVDLHFDLHEEFSEVRATLSVRRNPRAMVRPESLTLNGEQLELVSVSLDGRALDDAGYTLEADALTLPGVADRFELQTVCRLKPQENTALEGLYKSGGNFCTQCEAEGFRKITWFLDRPDVMSVFTTTIVADRDRYPVLLSNGNLLEHNDAGGGRHSVRWRDPFPKPCYLFALVAGDLVSREAMYRTGSGRAVALRVYVQAHNADKCDHALASLEKAMRWDEERFGLEYDLDVYMIVAVDDFNMGAMENKGLNVFNSKYVLARPETATDADYMAIEGVIAHEYFHNWTGNRVTCRDWFQLSLKEGLTVFRDQEFTADMHSRPVKRIGDVRLLRAHQFVEDAGPMAHPVRPQSYIEINNFYTVTVYEKGAEVVRMYQTLLGRDGFRKGMDLYFERHDGQAVTTDDFFAAMADANSADLSRFKRWYDQAGTPRLGVTVTWDPETRRYTLDVRQHRPPTPGEEGKLPLHIPLTVGLLGPDGADLSLILEGEPTGGPEKTSVTLSVREERETFTFLEVPERPVPSLLRDFSAPVALDYPAADEELAFQLAHDSDPFNRWDAGQKLAINQIMQLMAQHASGEPFTVDSAIPQAFGRVLDDRDLDPAMISEILSLPGETYLWELVDVIDVDAIHAARLALRRELAGVMEASLRETRERCASRGPYRFNAADSGRRRLGNLCLGYLNCLEDPDHARAALEQFQGSDNMTDMMGALSALNDRDGVERAEALKAFEERWARDTLVMDKWFSLQAVSALPDTLKTVRGLMSHELFTIRNPNKVRSLIGAFASGNPVNFHRVDGAGYRFLTDRVVEIDPLNPQVAARLAKVFSRWGKFDTQRRDLMRAELERIRDTAMLSRDTVEVVTKSLAAN